MAPRKTGGCCTAGLVAVRVACFSRRGSGERREEAATTTTLIPGAEDERRGLCQCRLEQDWHTKRREVRIDRRQLTLFKFGSSGTQTVLQEEVQDLSASIVEEAVTVQRAAGESLAKLTFRSREEASMWKGFLDQAASGQPFQAAGTWATSTCSQKPKAVVVEAQEVKFADQVEALSGTKVSTEVQTSVLLELEAREESTAADAGLAAACADGAIAKARVAVVAATGASEEAREETREGAHEEALEKSHEERREEACEDAREEVREKAREMAPIQDESPSLGQVKSPSQVRRVVRPAIRLVQPQPLQRLRLGQRLVHSVRASSPEQQLATAKMATVVTMVPSRVPAARGPQNSPGPSLVAPRPWQEQTVVTMQGAGVGAQAQEKRAGRLRSVPTAPTLWGQPRLEVRHAQPYHVQGRGVVRPPSTTAPQENA